MVSCARARGGKSVTARSPSRRQALGRTMTATDQPQVFQARIYKIGINRCVDVPRQVSAALGGGAHIPVDGWVEGLALKSTLVPRGRGQHRLHVHSRIWRKLRVDAGDTVEVMLLLDTEPRDPAVPEDLAAALAGTPRALGVFHRLTPALRREIVQWVNAAKRAGTREKRIALCVRRFLARAHPPKKK